MSTSTDLVTLLAELVNDPAGFWRLVLRGEPRAWQAKVCGEIRVRLERGEKHIRVLVRSCHGAGKTTLSVALAVWWAATRPHSRGLTTAPTWAAVEGVFWTELARMFNRSLLAQANVGRLLATSLEFAPGWDLVGLSTDHPVNLEGRHSPTAAIRVIDEAKAVEAAVFESTEPLLDAPETMDVAISTPSGPSGPFYDRDVKGGPEIIRVHVDVDMLIAEGLPGKTEWKAARLAEWGENSPEYVTRCLGLYADVGEGALFPHSWIERAEAATFDVAGPPVGGLDPAGSVSGDQSALAFVNGPDEAGRYRVLSVEAWHEADTSVTRGRTLFACRREGAATLAVDVQGFGLGVADAMRDDTGIGISSFRASAASSEPDRFVNAKGEMCWRLRSLLENGLIRLPKDADLKRQLAGMKYVLTSAGKIRTVDPSDSPDLADAVLVALSATAPGGDASARLWEAMMAANRPGSVAPKAEPAPAPKWRMTL